MRLGRNADPSRTRVVVVTADVEFERGEDVPLQFTEPRPTRPGGVVKVVGGNLGPLDFRRKDIEGFAGAEVGVLIKGPGQDIYREFEVRQVAELL